MYMCIYTVWSAEGSVCVCVCVCVCVRACVRERAHGHPCVRAHFRLTATPLIKDSETRFYRDRNKPKEIK